MKSIRSFSNFVFIVSILIFTDCESEVQNKSLPVLNTSEVSFISQSSAVSGGNIISDGGFSVTARGVCWSTKALPTIKDIKTEDGVSIGEFESEITGLNVSTNYYVRAYATTSKGTAYGESLQFTTKPSPPSTVTDIDGNVYNTVTIGSQTWLVENLKTSKYNDGSSIPKVTSSTEWSIISTPAYCWYKNEAANEAIYGALYNWYAVNTGKLAPAGWHVPTDAEWTQLLNYVTANPGTSETVAKALAANIYWSAHTFAGSIGYIFEINNSSGFTALPAGYRTINGEFYYLRTHGYWWSADAWSRSLYCGSRDSSHDYGDRSSGFSVRCVMD